MGLLGEEGELAVKPEEESSEEEESEEEESEEDESGEEDSEEGDSEEESSEEESSEEEDDSSEESSSEEEEAKEGLQKADGEVDGEEKEEPVPIHLAGFKGKAPKTMGKNTMVTRAAKLATKMGENGDEVTDEDLGKQGKTNLAKKFQGQHQSLIREPVLCLAPVGENWALDVFSLLHNGIRREMMDLYFILGEMRKMYLGLREDDISMFFDWFELFGSFLLDYFAVEEDVIYPWIEAKGANLKGELGIRSRMQMRGKVGHVMFRMQDARENAFQYLNYSEQYKKLLEFIDSFSSKLLDYFTAEELDLPPIISKYYKPSDKKKVDKDIYKFLIEQGRYPWAYVCILTRWMDSDRAKALWLNTHLSTRQKFDYRSWPHKFFEEHIVYTKLFSKRSAQFFNDQEDSANREIISGDLDILEDMNGSKLQTPSYKLPTAEEKIGKGDAKTEPKHLNFGLTSISPPHLSTFCVLNSG